MHNSRGFCMMNHAGAEKQIRGEECYNDSIAENGKRGAYRYAD